MLENEFVNTQRPHQQQSTEPSSRSSKPPPLRSYAIKHGEAIRHGIEKGSLVQLVGDPSRHGVIKWIGTLPEAKGPIAGVELVSSLVQPLFCRESWAHKRFFNLPPRFSRLGTQGPGSLFSVYMLLSDNSIFIYFLNVYMLCVI